MADISRNEINSNFYQIVETDANGNILYVKSEFVPASNVVAGGSNGAVQFNSNNVVSGSNGFTFNSNTNTVTAGAFVGSGTQLTNILATNIDGTVANAAYAITAGSVESINGSNVIGPVSEATTALSVSGANVVGSVANAVYADTANIATTATSATTAGTVTTNAQPNITSTGTLTSVDVTGNVSAGAVKTGNLLQANGAPYVFTSNAAGNTGEIQFNSNGAFSADPFFKYSSNSLIIGNTTTVSGLTAGHTWINISNGSIALNSTGLLPNVAYSISGFAVNASNLNVSSRVTSNLIPNATTQTLGNTSTGWGNLYLAANTRIWFGNLAGAYIQAAPSALSTANTLTFTTGNVVANSNVTATNFIGGGGNLSNIQASNISGTVANATYATTAGTADSVAGANVSGTVANATYATTAGTANSVDGINVSGTVANANYAAYASNIVTASQPNITSLGTLTSVTVAGNVESVDGIKFDTANGFIVTEGQLSWDNGAGTLDLGLTGSNVIAHLGEDLLIKASNDSGVQLTKGQIVYVSGSQGNRIAVKLAQANGELTSRGTLGMVAETIAINGTGYIITTGTVNQLDTDGLIAGYPIYLSATTPGAYTQTAPISPNHLVIIGWVQRVHQSVGSIYIKIDNGYELDELHNVTITSPANGQSLVYANGLWVNGIAENSVTVTGNNQSNITQVGTLSGLSVIGNIDVTGNFNVTGNINYSNVTDLVVGDPLIFLGANNTGDLVDLGFVSSYNDGTFEHTGLARNRTDGAWTFYDKVSAEPTTTIDWANASYPNVKTGPLTVVGNISATTIVANIDGANVTGTVANATHAANADYATVSASAYSVDGANVTGTVANATYSESSNTANIAYSVAGANVSGEVANATYANISGEAYSVAIANVSGIGNIASINLDGNVSNVLAGDGTWISNDTGTPTSLNADIGNVQIQGGNVSQVIITDGAGNLSFITAGVVATSADPYYLSYNAGANGCGYDNTIPGGDPIIFFNYTPDATDFMSKVPFTFILDDHLNTGIRFSINALSITTSYPYGGGTAVGITCTSTELGSAIGSGPNNYVIATEGILSLIPTRLAASVANVAITGGNINDVLKTDGNGVLSWTALPASNSISNGNSNITIANTDGNIRFHRNSELAFSIDDTAIYANKDTVVYGNISASNFSIVTGGGITFGDLTVQTTAASGNIVTINLDGNVSNVLAGDGTWITVNNVANANYANIAGEAYSVSGANVFGAVAYAEVANSVSGANVSGDVSSAIVAGTAYSVAGANVTGEVANATFATTAGSADSVAGANVTGEVANATFATTAGSADSVAGANVSGEVAFAATANSVAGANVSGDVSSAIVAGTAYSVSGANVSGAVANATFATTAGSADSVAGVNVSGTVANATYAVNAGIAYSVSGANVSGTVANATYAVSAGSASTADVANSVAGANVSGTVANATYAVSAGSATVADSANSVAVANVTGIGNIAVINLNGNGSQVLAGNGVFIAQSGGGGTPGGANTELQFNNNGSFGGISTVTYNGTNISLGAVTTIKITGGANAQVLSTDGTGNLSWVAQSGGGGGTETFAPFLLAGM